MQELGGLACDVRDRGACGDADVRLTLGPTVDTVAGHRNDMTAYSQDTLAHQNGGE